MARWTANVSTRYVRSIENRFSCLSLLLHCENFKFMQIKETLHKIVIRKSFDFLVNSFLLFYQYSHKHQIHIFEMLNKSIVTELQNISVNKVLSSAFIFVCFEPEVMYIKKTISSTIYPNLNSNTMTKHFT